MTKATIVLLVLAALGLGSLIGFSLVDKSDSGSPTAVKPESAVEPRDGAPVFRFVAPGDLAVELDDFGRAEPSATGENFIGRDKIWKTETVVVELPLDGKIEYKAIMAQGDSIVFDWTSDPKPVYVDFHGHDDAFGTEFFVRYEDGEGDEQAGMIVAGFSGEHGWYWLNMGDGPTTITLRVAGFFEKIIKLEVEDYQ